MINLDFSGLNEISANGSQAARDFETPAYKENQQPTEAGADREQPDTGNVKLQREADRITDERERAKAVYGEYQRNIKNGGLLINEIEKGIQSGADVYDLLLKALQVIGYCTADRSLYDRCKKMIISVYGDALKQPQPIRLELEEVNDRIKHLQAAADTCTDNDSRERLQRAIRAHRARADELTAAIKRE